MHTPEHGKRSLVCHFFFSEYEIGVADAVFRHAVTPVFMVMCVNLWLLADVCEDTAINVEHMSVHSV